MLESWMFSSLLPRRERAPASTAGLALSTGVCLVAALVLAPLFGWALAQEDRILLVVLVMVALIPLVIRWPVVSTFGLYAFLVPFDYVAALSEAGGGTLTRLVGIMAGGVLLVSGLIERRLVRPPAAALWLSVFMAWAVLTAAWAFNPDLAVQRLPTVASVFVLYLVAVSIRPSRREFHWVCLLVIAGGVAAAVMGYFYGVDTARATARGTLVVGERSANPNAFGAGLIVPIALAAGGFVGLRNPIQKLLAVGAVGLIGVGVYISMSRGALLAMIVTMLVFVFRTKVRWQVLVPIAMLLVLVVVLPETFFARVGKVLSGEDTTGAGRLEIWSVGLTALEHVGVFGTGLGNYTEIYRLSPAYSPGIWAKGPHNTYLGAWVEFGILGLVLLLAALASHLVAARTARRVGLDGILLAALEAACFGMLASSFFAERLWAKMFWLPWILLAWAIYNTRGNEQAQSNPS